MKTYLVAHAAAAAAAELQINNCSCNVTMRLQQTLNWYKETMKANQ